MFDDHTIAIAIRPYVAGGFASVLTTMCMHPIELTHTRYRLSSAVAEESKSGLGIIKLIMKDEGLRGFFSGISASIMRQAVYGTMKIGLHDSLSEKLKKRNEDHSIPFYQKALSASFAGFTASVAGSPFDLALVRIMNDSCYPPHLRHNYKSPFHAIYQIAKAEGARTLWRGCVPMMLSSISMNIGMLATYDQAKEMMLPFTGNGLCSILSASAISTFACSFLTLPFDMLKTRLITMNVDPDTKKYPYRNIFDCAIKVAKRGGIFSFWKGYSMYYARVAPYSMLTLLAKDTINSVYDEAFITY